MTNTQICPRCLIAERTRAAMKELAKTRKIGRPPFGFKFSGGQLVSDPNTHATFQLIIKLHKDGINPSRIAKILNEYGLKSQTGKAFSRNVIFQIISRHKRYNDKSQRKFTMTNTQATASTGLAPGSAPGDASRIEFNDSIAEAIVRGFHEWGEDVKAEDEGITAAEYEMLARRDSNGEHC